MMMAIDDAVTIRFVQDFHTGCFVKQEKALGGKWKTVGLATGLGEVTASLPPVNCGRSLHVIDDTIGTGEALTEAALKQMMDELKKHPGVIPLVSGTCAKWVTTGTAPSHTKDAYPNRIGDQLEAAVDLNMKLDAELFAAKNEIAILKREREQMKQLLSEVKLAVDAAGKDIAAGRAIADVVSVDDLKTLANGLREHTLSRSENELCKRVLRQLGVEID